MKNVKKTVLLFTVFCGLAISITSYFALNFFGERHIKEQKEIIRKEALIELEKICAQIDQSLNQKLFLAKSLAAFIQYDTNITKEKYNQFAKEIYELANQELQSVQLVRDSIITYNYPEEGNEKTIGKNILNVFDDRPLVSEAIKKQQPMFIGPRKLLQGPSGIIYREPILIDAEKGKSFWGFAAIIINMNELVSHNSIFSDEKIAIYSDNPSMFNQGFFYGDSSILEIDYVKTSIHLPSRDWIFYLSVKNKFLQFNSQNQSLFWISILLSVLLGVVCAREIYSLINAKKLNKILKEKNELISKQLDEKVLLIKEIHHRIKNHFQLISSLNQMLFREAKNEEAQDVIKLVNQRILTLSKAYDQFDNVEKASSFMPDYIDTLYRSLLEDGELNVKTTLQIEAIELSTKKTVTIGVLLNELIVNSLKHAFKHTEEPKILIKMNGNEKEYILTYGDNGFQLPENFLGLKGESTGVQLINLFTLQLGGQVIQFKNEDWIGIQIRFPKA